jgi:hypothetical protein
MLWVRGKLEFGILSSKKFIKIKFSEKFSEDKNVCINGLK